LYDHAPRQRKGARGKKEGKGHRSRSSLRERERDQHILYNAPHFAPRDNRYDEASRPTEGRKIDRIVKPALLRRRWVVFALHVTLQVMRSSEMWKWTLLRRNLIFFSLLVFIIIHMVCRYGMGPGLELLTHTPPCVGSDRIQQSATTTTCCLGFSCAVASRARVPSIIKGNLASLSCVLHVPKAKPNGSGTRDLA
jgi:hypothetical protein